MIPRPLLLPLALAVVSSAVHELGAAPTAGEEYAARACRVLPDGGVEYEFAVRVKADAQEAARLSVAVEGTKLFKVTALSAFEVPAGKEAVFPVKASLSADKARELLPFTPDTAWLEMKEAGTRKGWNARVPLRLGTPGPVHPPGKEFVDAVRARVANEAWAKNAAAASTNQAEKILAELGTPIEPPTEGAWIENDVHMWHWPKYPKLVTGPDGVKTCPECKKTWTPEQIRTGSARCSLYRNSLATLGMAAMSTGNERYAQAAREMLMGLARVYGSLAVGPQQTRLGLNYMIESRFDRDVIWGLRRLRTAGMLPDAELKEIAAGYLLPSLETVIECGAGTPNIMMLRACAVGQAGLVLNWPPYVAWGLRDEKKGMIPFTSKLIGEDGGWLEGSLSYHMTTHMFLTPFPAELKLYGYDVMQEKEFGERLRRFYRFPMLALRPDKRLVAIADSGLGSPAMVSNAGAYWLTREPGILPWLNKDLEFAVDDAPEPPRIEFKSRNFPDFGVTILHDGGELGRENWVLVRHGPHAVGHGHFDILNAVSYAHGQPVHDDLGSVYSDPRHFGWLKNTVSHNTINVDEKGQQPTTGKLEVLSIPEKGPQVLVASDEGAFKGVRLERALVLVQGVQLYVDRAASADEHLYDWIYTCYGKVSASSAESKEIPPLPGKPLTPEDVADNPYQAPLGRRVGYEIPHNLREMNVSGDWWLDWQGIKAPYSSVGPKPIEKPPVAMKWLCWSSGPTRVVWGDSPGMGLKPDQHRWVMARQKTREAAWVTALVPSAEPSLVDALEVVQPNEGKGLGVRLKSGQGGAWVAVNWQPGQPLKVGPISTKDQIVVQP